MAVTPPLLDRALDILNRIAWQLERNGSVFECGPRLRDSTIKLRYGGLEGAIVRLFIMEVIERERNGPMDDTTWCYDQWVCRSTGRLRVVIDEYFPPNVRKSWSYGQTQRLEEVTAEITEGIVLHGKVQETQRLAQLEQEPARQAEERARLAEAERRATAEIRLRAAHEMSGNWHRANELRGSGMHAGLGLPARQTRADPLKDIWRLAEAFLAATPELEAKALFEHLLARLPAPGGGGDATTARPRRCSSRRRYGRASGCKWTGRTPTNWALTIQSVPFDHPLCHAVLCYSNVQHATPCRSESMLSLKAGLPAALLVFGGAPNGLLTDQSSTATHRLKRGEAARGFNQE